jgi:hypothetical protein
LQFVPFYGHGLIERDASSAYIPALSAASARWSAREVAERGYDGFDLLTRR